MAEETTTQDQDVESEDLDLEADTTSSSMIFSEEELAELEKEFSGDESAQDEGEEADGEEGDEDLDEEESEDEDETSTEGTDGDEEDEADDEEVEEEGAEFVLTVEGEEYEVNDVDALARLAQKGIFYEKRDAQTQQALKSANFTMNAMIHDHFGFLEEYYAQQMGDYESARAHVAKIAHNYLVPYYKELQAEPEQQQLLREKRQLERDRRNNRGGAGQQNGQVTFTQEDIAELQTLEHNITTALGEVGLPKDSAPLRKRMADLMLGALERDQNMHPLTAAKLLLEERKQLHAELSRTLPKGGRRRQKTPEQRERDIAATRQRRSRKKPGAAQSQPRRRKEPARTYTGREFLDELDSVLGLERYE